MFRCFFCAMCAVCTCTFKKIGSKNNLSAASTIIIASLSNPCWPACSLPRYSTARFRDFRSRSWSLSFCATHSHKLKATIIETFLAFLAMSNIYYKQPSHPKQMCTSQLGSRACRHYTYFYMLQQGPNVNKVTLSGLSSLKGLRGS